MTKDTVVTYTKRAEKDIKRLAVHIKKALLNWTHTVELNGIREVRKSLGYHDEPLKGKRKGQRSVRLSKGYRVIYEENELKEIILLEVQEVTNHEY